MSELNRFGSFHLKQGLVYIKSPNYCKRIYTTFDENDELCATNTRDHVDSRGKIVYLFTCKDWIESILKEKFE